MIQFTWNNQIQFKGAREGRSTQLWILLGFYEIKGRLNTVLSCQIDDFSTHRCADVCGGQPSALCVAGYSTCFAGDTLFVSSLQPDSTDVFMGHLHHAGSHNGPSGLSLVHSPRCTALLSQADKEKAPKNGCLWKDRKICERILIRMTKWEQKRRGVTKAEVISQQINRLRYMSGVPHASWPCGR